MVGFIFIEVFYWASTFIKFLLTVDIFLFIDDLEPNSLAVIPGMGIPEQLKLAMEQEQMGKKSYTCEFYFYNIL